MDSINVNTGAAGMTSWKVKTAEAPQINSSSQMGIDEFVKTGNTADDMMLMAEQAHQLRQAKTRTLYQALEEGDAMLLEVEKDFQRRQPEIRANSLEQKIKEGDDMMMELERSISKYGLHSKALDEKIAEDYYAGNRAYLAQHPDAVVEIGPGQLSNMDKVRKMMSEKLPPLQTWVFDRH